MRALRWFGIGLAVLAFAGCSYVGIFGSVIVHDDTGQVVSAIVTDDHREQPLLRLPGGLFFAVPDVEGTIEVRCRGGAKGRAGYVTGFTHISVRVTGPVPCGRIVEER